MLFHASEIFLENCCIPLKAMLYYFSLKNHAYRWSGRCRKVARCTDAEVKNHKEVYNDERYINEAVA